MARTAATGLATTATMATAGSLGTATGTLGVLGGQARQTGPRTDRQVRRTAPDDRTGGHRGPGRADDTGTRVPVQRRGVHEFGASTRTVITTDAATGDTHHPGAGQRDTDDGGRADADSDSGADHSKTFADIDQHFDGPHADTYTYTDADCISDVTEGRDHGVDLRSTADSDDHSHHGHSGVPEL
ncbi:hypothetical protein ACWGID_20360 [Kribbella sp. NPDC054772]